MRETPNKLPVGAPNEHPDWVCNDCGQDRYGSPCGVSTWHEDTCGICGEEKYVTEPRDFCGYYQRLTDARPEADKWPISGDNEDADTIPLWKQALWLARHIEDLHSPRPDVVSDDELRGMTLIRVLGIGADEHGDEVFRKGSPELHEDRAEEWSDGEFYDLVDRFGEELRCTPAGAT